MEIRSICSVSHLKPLVKGTGTSSQNVEWSIGGTQCVGMTDCGTITAAGLFTAPATVPNPAEITVTATAKANTKYSGSAVVTVTSAPTTPSAIKGDYTFLLNGSDAEGRFSMAGSFVADGAGNLHDGKLRVCREQSCADQSFAGTTSPSTKETGSFENGLTFGNNLFVRCRNQWRVEAPCLGHKRNTGGRNHEYRCRIERCTEIGVFHCGLRRTLWSVLDFLSSAQ